MRFLFGDCVLDVARRELRREGKTVPVEPQVFDLLMHLLRHRDRVVSKDDLLDAVWGGRIVSESTLSSRINAARRAVGDGGAEQGMIRTLTRRGFRFVGPVQEESGAARPEEDATASAEEQAPRQDLIFRHTADGVALAIACTGSGPTTLLKTANWLTHIEHDWRSPFWAPLLRQLAQGRRLVRYDARGCGISDRNPPEISFEAFLRDLECVAEATCPDRPVALLGISQGAAVATAFAAIHPERVSHLVLLGGYAQGRRRRETPEDNELADAVLALMRHGWGNEQSAFMRAFASLYYPTAAPAQLRGWAALQQISASAEMAVRIRLACDDIDISELLPRVRAPTLVLHCHGDGMAPFEQGRRLAAGIPGARFMAFDSANHIVLPEEPEWPRMMATIEQFLIER